jgi:MFS family permease
MSASGREATFSDGEVRTIALATIAGVVFGGVATGVAFPTLPLLGDILGISAIMLGVILSANRFTRLPLNAPAGNVIDRLGARKPMIVGLFAQALAPFGYVLGMVTPAVDVATVPGIGPVSAPGVVFLVSRMCWGVGSAFVFIGAFAIISHVTTHRNRGRWLGYMRGGQSLGFPSGLVLGGVLADLVSPTIAFLTAGILALLAGLVAGIVLPDVRPESEERARLRDIPRMIGRQPLIFPMGLGNLTIRFMFGGILLASVAQYADAYGMELSVLTAAGISGAVLAFGVISAGAATVISGRVSDRISNRIVVTIPAFASLALGLFVLAQFPRIEFLFLACGLMGLGTGGIGPALLALVGDMTPGPELGRMGGAYNFMGDLGLTAGPLVALPLVSAHGYQVVYLACGLAVVLAALLVTVPLLHWNVSAGQAAGSATNG